MTNSATTPNRFTHSIVKAKAFVSESYGDHSVDFDGWTDAEIFGFVAEHHTDGLEAVRQPTYAEELEAARVARKALMERDLTPEELARLRDAGDLTADYRTNCSYAVGALVFDKETGWWLSRTIARNVHDVHYALKQAATNPNVKDLHFYPEGF
jgi:hypothetical protein